MLKAQSAASRVMVIAIIAAVAFGLILTASIKLAHCLAGTDERDGAAWVQAVGAIMAIVVGFATILCQRALEIADADAVRVANARAAHLVAAHAMTTVGERLDAVLAPEDAKHPYRLRGERTAEMVAGMRDFDTARLPHEMLEKFLQLRANLHAINERISDVYDSEQVTRAAPRPRNERPSRLEAAIVIWRTSRTLLEELQGMLINAGQSELADAPQAFDFEQSAATSAVRTK